MRKKLVPEERAPFGVVTAYRGRGNYLQRLEQFEKAILAYDEALRWNSSDVRSLLGRSLARAKATHYTGALADAAKATELEPENLTAKQIRAQTEYEKSRFERALVLAHRGQRIRRFPPNFAQCARIAEETVRECVGRSAGKVLSKSIPLLHRIELKRESVDADAPIRPQRKSRMLPQPTHQVQEMSRVEKQKSDQISRLLASMYLERMAHDKRFLYALCKDERLKSANKQGSETMQNLAEKALADLEKRQEVLRERRPLYASRNTESTGRLAQARKQRLAQQQQQHTTDATRLVNAALAVYEEHDTAKCLESVEFSMEQITRKPGNLLPGKEKFLNDLYDIVGNAFLDQKRARADMSETDRERRAFVLLGLELSREPSRDSVLRVRPPAPPRDARRRLRALERALTLNARASERCYLLHELARLHSDMKQPHRARFFAGKCQTESRACGHRTWLLNSTFLLAKCHVMQNNRPEARAALLEGVGLARAFGQPDVSAFFDTCANVSTEGEVASSAVTLEQREKAMVSLMQDDDLKSAAEHLFRRMSALPAARRFSIMPGATIGDSEPAAGAARRVSIMPRAQQPTRVTFKSTMPLGVQEFDL